MEYVELLLFLILVALIWIGRKLGGVLVEIDRRRAREERDQISRAVEQMDD